MTRRRDLSADEAKLWRRVAKTTKAYKSLPAVPAIVAEAEKPSIALKPAHPELPHLALKRLKAVQLTVASPGVPTRPATKAIPIADASGHKRIRRGKLEIDARIDLHGMRQIDAQTSLAGIIARTRRDGGRCILVITGKGRPIDPGEDFITPQPGVIRRRLPEWLNAPSIKDHVSGYASAHAKDGGSGAYYVLLKSIKSEV
jgi:DNA-nicking Smr family endonuclease